MAYSGSYNSQGTSSSSSSSYASSYPGYWGGNPSTYSANIPITISYAASTAAASSSAIYSSQSQYTAPTPARKPGFKLRRAIQPRAPLTILNELVGGNSSSKILFDFYDVPEEERRRRAWQADIHVDDVGMFECKCTAQGLEFIAEGATKADAKNAVVEVAIQGLITDKCLKNETEGVGANEDNCPWAAIASLALYKLYNTWQAQGYNIPPELTSLPGEGWNCWGQSNSSSYKVNSSYSGGSGNSVQNTILDKPPLQVVNEMASRMKISLEFELSSEVGMPNDRVFTFTVKVGDKTYSGQGKNKKSAKQAAASALLDDQDNWYAPPLPPPTPPGEEEIEEEVETPAKRRTILNEEEMANLLGGDGRPDVDEKVQSKEQSDGTTFVALEDKGKQPGSHPSNK